MANPQMKLKSKLLNQLWGKKIQEDNEQDCKKSWFPRFKPNEGVFCLIRNYGFFLQLPKIVQKKKENIRLRRNQNFMNKADKI